MFEVGSIVVCVDDNEADGHVTNGSVYEVAKPRSNDKDLTYVIDNFGNNYGLFSYRFKLHEELRKEVW